MDFLSNLGKGCPMNNIIGCPFGPYITTLGSIVLVYYIFKLFFGFIGLFFYSNPNLLKMGKYAVVTGATDGIGFAYACELAKKGMSVILISRSEEKLKEKQDEIKQKYPSAETMVIAADFSKFDDNLVKKLTEKLENLEIGVLINNVGVSYDHAEYLSVLENEKIKNIIDVNINAATYLTRIVLPQMTQRKKGVIINVGSAAGIIPVGDPLYTIYSASKAYVDFFSRSLHYELKDKGIIVQCQIPYFVTSKMSKIRNSSLFVPSANSYAKSGLNCIGNGQPTTVPYLPHRLQHFLINSLPTWIAAWYVLSHHHSIRKRALAKKNQEKAK